MNIKELGKKEITNVSGGFVGLASILGIGKMFLEKTGGFADAVLGTVGFYIWVIPTYGWRNLFSSSRTGSRATTHRID